MRMRARECGGMICSFIFFFFFFFFFFSWWFLFCLYVFLSYLFATNSFTYAFISSPMFVNYVFSSEVILEAVYLNVECH